MKKRLLVCMLFITALLFSCEFSHEVKEGKYRITNINIYRNTEAWELAKAVNSQSVSKIKRIAQKRPDLLDFQDPKYQTTLLVWAVGMEKYKSAEALLKCGADPDIISKYEGGTALYLAAGFSWIDSFAKKDPKYVKLLIKYGADPNINYVGREEFLVAPSGIKLGDVKTLGESPLMESIGCGLEKTKALVEAGAKINHKSSDDRTAAVMALFWGEAEYAHYLIVEKKADITEPYFINIIDDPNIPKDTEYFPVHLLRDWVFRLDSNDYKLKMEIVDEFARQGVDYWSEPIHERTLEHIKKLYPDSWQEYSKIY